jgi:hypothetical protein
MFFFLFLFHFLSSSSLFSLENRGGGGLTAEPLIGGLKPGCPPLATPLLVEDSFFETFNV